MSATDLYHCHSLAGGRVRVAELSLQRDANLRHPVRELHLSGLVVLGAVYDLHGHGQLVPVGVAIDVDGAVFDNDGDFIDVVCVLVFRILEVGANLVLEGSRIEGERSIVAN